MKNHSRFVVILFYLSVTFVVATRSPAAQVNEVIVVFKTHFDIGYTDMASNVVQRYRTEMMDNALKVVDENRDLPPEQKFVWTVPGWPATKMLEDWPGQTPERQLRVRQAFKDGRFIVHALPFNIQTEMYDPEDLVRSLGYSSRLTRSLSLELPRDAKMTDVPSHSWILPTLLRHAGVDFLHLGCNPASSSPQVPLLFWWEGPDGSRLLTMYYAPGYGTQPIPPADWPYHVWLALIMTGDNQGPPKPEEVAKLLAELKEKLPGVKVRIGRLSDFYDALGDEKTNAPIVRGDMPDTWIEGVMCDPAGTRLARNLHPLMGDTESLATHLLAWGVQTEDPSLTLALAREQSLLYNEHTWGGADYWVSSYGKDQKASYGEKWKAEHATGRFKHLEDSWDEHLAYIEHACDLTEPLLNQEMKTLADSVKVQGQRIVVFNPLPWKRDGLVTLQGLQPTNSIKAVDSGDPQPTWVSGDALCFVAHDLPPSGYRTYQLVPAEEHKTKLLRADLAANSLESPFFKAVVDPARGDIISLVDRRTGRELVDTSAAPGFGYLYERFASNNVADYVEAYVKWKVDWAVAELGKPNLPPDVPYRAVSPTNCSLTFEQSAGAVTAVMNFTPSASLPYGVTTRLTLYNDLPYADLEVTVHDKPADPWPEAGWISLPFKMDAPQFRLGRLGGIVDPVHDLVPGANHDMGAIHTGVALMDKQGWGVGVCPLDSPVISLDRPGLWRYSPDFTPHKPRLFINLFNNQYNTNYRLWNSGTWTSRVRIWSFKRYDADAGLVTPALEARYSLLATIVDGGSGALPVTDEGLMLSRKGVSITAFGPNPDGSGIVLRLWEYAGKSGSCKVELPSGLKAASAQPIDLRGQPIGSPLIIQDHAFTTHLDAFAPSSFQLLPAAAQ